MEGYSWYKTTGLILGIVLFALILLFFRPGEMEPEQRYPAAVAAAAAAMMVCWWITEAVPLPATALVPLAMFPLLGVLPMNDVGASYADRNIWLFAGGFFIAMAMQKWDLHERIALNMVYRTGTKPRGLVLGFMIATAFLSMWISNTATTMMMLPIAMAIIEEVDIGRNEGDGFAVALLLGVAYAASIGGVGTLIGTPPNVVLASQFTTLFPDAPEISFVHWLFLGLPFVVVFLFITWLVLCLVFPLGNGSDQDTRGDIRQRIDALGAMSRGEKIVLTVSIMTALAWMTRPQVQIGGFTYPGWASLFPNPAHIHDGTVSIFFALVLFLLPVNLKKGEFALDWEWAKRIPWGILILFGGGLALANGFRTTGMVQWLGSQLSVLSDMPPLVVVLAIAFLMTFLTEMTSNTATTTIMLPILAVTAANVLGVHPLLLMIPATISASCAFMLPVATPPNAIVFGGGHVTVPQMARAGVILNFIGIALVTLATYFVGVPVFEITLDALPPWASP